LDKCTDYEATIEMIANLLVSSLASWCAIDLVTEDFKVERVIVVHHDPSKADLAKQILLHHPSKSTGDCGVYKVIETGQSFLIPKATWNRRADSAEHLSLITELGSTSYMCVPLKARGKVVGSIMLLSGDRTYDERDLHTAEELARYIAMAVDNVQMFRKMQDAIKARDEFLAILSHELRTPLNVIQGWIDILKSENLGETGFRQAIDILDRNSQLQSRMINDLLDVSRIISGKIAMDLVPVNLGEVLSMAVQSTLLSAHQKKISLQTRIATEPGMILGDIFHLERMVLNLLSNAVKFTPSGGLVELTLELIEDDAVITVQDTGKGIDPEFIPYIFESFRQENSTTTRLHGGLGLGLAITKHIVDQHGGVIVATSQGKSKGAKITVRLPLLREMRPAPRMPTPLVPVASSKFVLKGVRVLLVDDAEDIRILLTRYLENSGAEVVAVSSAAQAFEELQRIKPDILLSDIGMPEEDGYGLITRIRNLPEQQGGRTVAIALTAYAREEEKHKALFCGFNFHLPKPIFSPILISTICKLRHIEVTS
jgi:signal transduction histidine kinase/CheY-like chemotaxis protein